MLWSKEPAGETLRSVRRIVEDMLGFWIGVGGATEMLMAARSLVNSSNSFAAEYVLVSGWSGKNFNAGPSSDAMNQWSLSSMPSFFALNADSSLSRNVSQGPSPAYVGSETAKWFANTACAGADAKLPRS